MIATFIPSLALARQLIDAQFPEYTSLRISEVERQGHDNRTYRLGDNMLIRMPTAAHYAQKIAIEQDLLPQLAPHLSLSIPTPLKKGEPCLNYPYPFSIYRWLPGRSINLLALTDQAKIQLALDLAQFLQELQSINDIPTIAPGSHNFWRGHHVAVYDVNTRTQIAELADFIDASKAMDLWNKSCATRWHCKPVWIHGDLAIGNMLMESSKLSAIIDFGGVAAGDPACDLTIAWTYLPIKARDLFIEALNLDQDTWLRARAWTLWKATYELCQIDDKHTHQANAQKKIIHEVLNA